MEATTFGMFIYADICVLVMYATSSFWIFLVSNQR
jgi:hypothetical protein